MYARETVAEMLGRPRSEARLLKEKVLVIDDATGTRLTDIDFLDLGPDGLPTGVVEAKANPNDIANGIKDFDDLLRDTPPERIRRILIDGQPVPDPAAFWRALQGLPAGKKLGVTSRTGTTTERATQMPLMLETGTGISRAIKDAL